MPKNKDGKPGHDKAMAGDDLRDFANGKLFSWPTRARTGGRSQTFSQVGDKFDGCDARQKQVRSGFGRNEG